MVATATGGDAGADDPASAASAAARRAPTASSNSKVASLASKASAAVRAASGSDGTTVLFGRGGDWPRLCTCSISSSSARERGVRSGCDGTNERLVPSPDPDPSPRPEASPRSSACSCETVGREPGAGCCTGRTMTNCAPPRPRRGIAGTAGGLARTGCAPAGFGDSGPGGVAPLLATAIMRGAESWRVTGCRCLSRTRLPPTCWRWGTGSGTGRPRGGAGSCTGVGAGKADSAATISLGVRAP
mmetsp:Transcript_21522/g.54620  ORF Transcript_21522/g.54620 Transcript_21522/m.54620 type:complete len:244 (-) Transcript_21522:432-1163(-)